MSLFKDTKGPLNRNKLLEEPDPTTTSCKV